MGAQLSARRDENLGEYYLVHLEAGECAWCKNRQNKLPPKGCFSRRSSKEDYGPEKQRRGWKLVFQTFDTTLVSPKVRHVLFPVYLRSSRWKVLLPRPAREQAKSSCSIYINTRSTRSSFPL